MTIKHVNIGLFFIAAASLLTAVTHCYFWQTTGSTFSRSMGIAALVLGNLYSGIGIWLYNYRLTKATL